MTQAQEWLNENYPKLERGDITKLDISSHFLLGSLDLSDFPQLTHLDCSNNQLTNLDLSNCPWLTSLDCSNNPIANLGFLMALNPEQFERENKYKRSFSRSLLNLDDNSRKELNKHKRLFERNEWEDFRGSSIAISNALLLSRWQKANRRLRIKFLQERLVESKEQLKELESQKTKLVERNAVLEILIQESEEQIKLQKQQVTQAYLTAFSEEEERACQEIVKIHQKYLLAKKERKEVNAIYRQFLLLRQKLETRLGEKFIETLETILTDFTELYQYKWILERETKEKEVIYQYQVELERLRSKIDSGVIGLKAAIRNKVSVSECQKLVTANRQILSRVVSLIQDKDISNYQLTSQQNERLQTLELFSGWDSSLAQTWQSEAEQQQAETEVIVDLLQAQIKQTTLS